MLVPKQNSTHGDLPLSVAGGDTWNCSPAGANNGECTMLNEKPVLEEPIHKQATRIAE